MDINSSEKYRRIIQGFWDLWSTSSFIYISVQSGFDILWDNKKLHRGLDSIFDMFYIKKSLINVSISNIEVGLLAVWQQFQHLQLDLYLNINVKTLSYFLKSNLSQFVNISSSNIGSLH